MVSEFFQKRNTFIRVGLWVLVGMISLGLLGTSVAWYLGSASERPRRDSAAPQKDVIAAERENQEALRKQYEGMLNSKPDDLAVLTGYARVEMSLGELYLQEEDEAGGREAFQRSAELYRKALEQQDAPQLRLELANVYQMLQEASKAEGELQKVLQEDPENIKALAQMGILLESREDWDGAIKIWEKISSSPQADQMTRLYAKSHVEEIQQKK